MASYKPTNDQKANFMKDALRRVYGNRCMICGMTWENFKLRWPNAKDWLLEHRNGDNTDYDFDNCQLSCYSCNQRKRPDFQEDHLTTIKPERVSTQEGENAIENYQKQEVKRKASLEIQLCQDYEPLIRRYIWENASRDGGLRLKDAIKEAGEYSGADVQTVERKLDKAFSRIGPFDVERDANGEPLDDGFISIKSNYKPNIQTAMGKLDYQIMFERVQKADEARIIKEMALEKAAKELADREEQQKKQTQKFNEVAREREQYAKIIEQVTGKPLSEVMKELQQGPPTEPKAFAEMQKKSEKREQ